MKLTEKLLHLAAKELARRAGKARMNQLSEKERRELGQRGGQARAKRMTAEERREAARKAVRARWAKAKKKE